MISLSDVTQCPLHRRFLARTNLVHQEGVLRGSIEGRAMPCKGGALITSVSRDPADCLCVPSCAIMCYHVLSCASTGGHSNQDPSCTPKAILPGTSHYCYQAYSVVITIGTRNAQLTASTGEDKSQDPSSAQKAIYYSVFTQHVWS